GVPISHRSAVHFVEAEADIFSIRGEDRVYQGFSVAFDASVEEIWLAWRAGATLVAASDSMAKAGPDLAGLLGDAGITVLSCVPTLLSMMRDDIPTLRLLILGGEACPQELVRRWHRPGRRIVNTYGPTEATVIATYADCHPDQPVMIGRPIPGMRACILDTDMRPVAAGEIGELHLGGVGLSPGYLNRPDLTAKNFVPDPFSDDAAERLYKTGDLARYAGDGQIEFIGRADTQVKLRGYRIELAEIEAVFLESPAVQSAAVAMRSDAQGGAQLIGYIVPKVRDRLCEREIREELRRRLPPHMVPALIEIVDGLPTLPSGKVDRARLPAPCPRKRPVESGLSPMEEQVRVVWERLLAPVHVEPDADFFAELGGHSLVAAMAVSELRSSAAFAELSVADIYNFPTVRRLVTEMRRRAVPLNRPADGPAEHRVVAAAKSGRHVLCGFAMAVGLYVVLGIASIQLLVPYLTYSRLIDAGNSWLAALAEALGALLATYPLMLLIAIAAKWLLLGKIKPGRHPLWGVYYFRWWLAHQIIGLAPVEVLTGTPLACLFVRLMGARIGRDVHLGTDAFAAFDLLNIGDGSSIGDGASLLGYAVVDGTLNIAPIRIGRDCFVGARSVVAPGATLDDTARLEDLSLLPANARIPAAQTWAGSPARQVDQPAPITSPVHRPAASLLPFALAFLTLPVVYLAAAAPGMALMNFLARNTPGDFFLLASPIAAAMFIALFCLEIATFKRLALGRVIEGAYPIGGKFYRRKWFFDRLMEMSLELVGPLYGTLYLPSWLRMLGVRVGPLAEVSTACAIVPDLLRLEEGSFIADAAYLGGAHVEQGMATLGAVTVGRRAFIGNSAVVAPGLTIGENSLIGVLSNAPDAASRSDTSWLGSPAINLPRRQCSTCAADTGEEATYSPPPRLMAQRRRIELARILLPGTFIWALISAAIKFLSQIRPFVSPAVSAAIFPGIVLLCGVASLGILWVFKRALIVRYTAGEWPLWCKFVWKTELITALHDCLAAPLLLDVLTGTPFLPWCYRLLGAKIGRRVFLDTTEFTEFDLVEIGDDAALNADCTIQTHLFEDRVMKVSNVRIGDRCTVGAESVVLYDSIMQAGSSLGPLSLLMKGETLPAGTGWEGTPAQASKSA
ncbi:MAG: Pls/PosA family non-ribosomal peptide synthetase, partial [Tepidisphaeraceae bacterium]